MYEWMRTIEKSTMRKKPISMEEWVKQQSRKLKTFERNKICGNGIDVVVKNDG